MMRMLRETFLYKGLRRLIKGSDLQRRFTDIYKDNAFGGKESVSGPGSDLTQTQALREALPAMLKGIGARTMLDAPCGDFFWMKEVRVELEQYIGADIVPALIAENTRRYGNQKREFRRLDLTRDALPRTDLILCRDCLVHLPLAVIVSALKNFKRSGSRYLLTTTFTARTENPDIQAGQWRPLNLQAAPFNFPAPEQLVNECCTEGGGQYPDKSMGLWKIDALP